MHPADGFLEELNSVLVAMDENATMEFTGDEESDDFIFAGYGSKNGFRWLMDDDVTNLGKRIVKKRGLITMKK